MCTLSLEVPGGILSCDYGYHIECFILANRRCQHCYKYLCDDIEYHCKIFQNTLNMAFDDNVDKVNEELVNKVDLQESNLDEVICTDDINSKLVEALESFK
ncbi:2114_t:CDS:1 [Funneliformis geosporum]|nr:2114_t:CDS:1 [Funneliformis geosporum]